MKQTLTKLLGGALFALFLLMPSVVGATTETIPVGTNRTAYEGTSFTTCTQMMSGQASGDYIKFRTAEGTPNWQLNVKAGYKITGISIEGYANNTTTGYTISLTSLTVDDVNVLGSTVVFPINNGQATKDTETANITGINAYSTIGCTFDNSNVGEGGQYQIMAIVTITYEQLVTAAQWTFDTGYSIDGRICTPNSDSWEAIPEGPTQAKNNSAYQFNANTRYHSDKNSLAYIGNDNTGKTYYQVKDNNGDKVLNLYPNGTVNAIDGDYTNEAKHLLFYEFSFPTTGLKDIKISVEFTYYNADGKTMEMVYSTNNGSTWTDAGSIAGGANWYTYNTSTTALSADNKTNVTVRLLPEDGSSLQVYINNVTITGTRATTAVTISDAKYATYYNSIPVELPENLQAATIDGETSGTLTLNWRYAEGDVIPGGTPVLLKATTADTYNLIYATDNTESAPSGNLLYGSDIETTTTGGGSGAKYYALQYGTGGNADVLGFYWVNASGAAFTSEAHKAWLALPAATPARFFSLDDSETTSINAVQGSQFMVNEYFDLQGRRVAQPTKGLYIVNGKKVIIK